MVGYTPLTYQETLSLASSSSSSSSSSFDETEKFIPDLETNDTRFSLPPPSPLPPRHYPPRSLLKRTLIFLLPSFLQPGYTPPTPKSPTAYLDGIRGLAALFVFFCHYLYTCYTIATGYGYTPPPPPPPSLHDSDELFGGEWSDAGPYNEPTSYYYNTTYSVPLNPYQPNHFHPLKLPFLRLLYSGPPMVAVFFVISGYALSLKPLTLLSSQNIPSFSTTLSSLVFRRGLRLFLPPAISTLLIIVLVRLGAYSNTDDFAHDAVYIRNVQETHYEALNSTAEQLVDWTKGVGQFIHVWDWDVFGGLTRMDVHLWTIPVEFRASMMLFLVLIGTAGVKRGVRWGLVGGGVMGYCFGSGRWEMMLFLWGMGLAEVDVHSKEKEKVHGRDNNRRGSWWWTGLSVLGLFFMSQPDQGSESAPGWVTLTNMIPSWWIEEERYRYYQSLGAALFVLAVGRSKGWQGVFTLGPIQYLGRISYAMYLMHGPVLHTFGYAVERFVWTRITGVETEGRYNLGFGLAAVVIVPAVIWVSDVFWRGVDAPVVRFARWVEGVCSVKE